MARVNPYVQDAIASSLGIMAKPDTSGVELAQNIENNSGKLAQAAFNLAAQKQREVEVQRAKLQNINDTLTAYQKATEAETQMWQMIDETKKEYITDPKKGLEVMQERGMQIVTQTIRGQDNNVNVQEKMSGILTNSLRGKITEAHSWSLAQDTANAKTKIQNVFLQMKTQASLSSDPLKALELIKAFEDDDTKEMDFNNLINYAYGAKGLEEIEKAKTGIAEAFILGMLDRGESHQALALLDSGQFDSYMSPEAKHKFRGYANTAIKAAERQEKIDNYLQIFDIKQNAIIKASEGKYSISEAIADNNRIEALGGKPTTAITTQGVKGERIKTEQERKQKHSTAIRDITDTLGRMTKKGKIDPELELKDIIAFQNKVESYKPYLSDNEYKTYMTKVNEPAIKRIRKMGKNIFGLPQGDLSGKDVYNKAYLSMYNFAEKAYAGKDNKNNAIHNMISDFVKCAEQLEAKQSKAMTLPQAQNLVNKVIMDQRRRTNKNLNNIPDNGKILRDKNGRVVKMYPNGKYEIIK